MSLKKIIFIVETIFQQRDYHRFGVEVLLGEGFEVEIWEVFPFTRPGDGRYVPPDPVAYQLVRRFANARVLADAIGRLQPQDIAVVVMGMQAKHQIIFRMLSEHDVCYGRILTAFPQPLTVGKSRRQRIGRKLLHPMSMVNSILMRLPNRWKRIKAFGFVVLAGGSKVDLQSWRDYIRPTTSIIWAHALDYDLFLEARTLPLMNRGRYMLFLDEYMPFHPDFAAQDIPVPCAPESYYAGLAAFFESIEKATCMPVLIAAHPRSRYEDHPDFFRGREIIRGKTVQLVREAALTVLHCSTALNFSVLFRKPTIFLTSEALRNSYCGPYVEAMAARLGKRTINLDSDSFLKLDREMALDEAAYSRYRNDYIKKPGTPEELLWKVASRCFQELSPNKIGSPAA